MVFALPSKHCLTNPRPVLSSSKIMRPENLGNPGYFRLSLKKERRRRLFLPKCQLPMSRTEGYMIDLPWKEQGPGRSETSRRRYLWPRDVVAYPISAR